jgi:magnesium-transporting ATPase (P-type)
LIIFLHYLVLEIVSSSIGTKSNGLKEIIILSLVFKLLIEFCINLFFYYRVRRMETAWNQSHISKISHGSKKVWKKAMVSELKVGDMILLRNETIVPADVLILCTSELLHSEMILFANERKITGKNKISVKNAVRNLLQGSFNIS